MSVFSRITGGCGQKSFSGFTKWAIETFESGFLLFPGVALAMLAGLYLGANPDLLMHEPYISHSGLRLFTVGVISIFFGGLLGWGIPLVVLGVVIDPYALTKNSLLFGLVDLQHDIGYRKLSAGDLTQMPKAIASSDRLKLRVIAVDEFTMTVSCLAAAGQENLVWYTIKRLYETGQGHRLGLHIIRVKSKVKEPIGEFFFITLSKDPDSFPIDRVKAWHDSIFRLEETIQSQPQQSPEACDKITWKQYRMIRYGLTKYQEVPERDSRGAFHALNKLFSAHAPEEFIPPEALDRLYEGWEEEYKAVGDYLTRPTARLVIDRLFSKASSG